MQPSRIGDVSFWYADLGGLPPKRPPLDGDTTADVCIIGAGYTGLWSAWYLKQADPALRILIVEKEFAGFGASGRNGGWLTGGFAWSHDKYLSTGTPDGVRAMVQAMNGTVDEVIRVAALEGIDADIRRTDELMVAVTPAQVARMTAEVAHRRHWGEDPGRVLAIGAEAARARVNIPGLLGGMVVTGVARIQPARPVRGGRQLTHVVTAPRRHRCARVGQRRSTVEYGHVRGYHGQARPGEECVPVAWGGCVGASSAAPEAAARSNAWGVGGAGALHGGDGSLRWRTFPGPGDRQAGP